MTEDAVSLIRVASIRILEIWVAPIMSLDVLACLEIVLQSLKSANYMFGSWKYGTEICPPLETRLLDSNLSDSVSILSRFLDNCCPCWFFRLNG